MSVCYICAGLGYYTDSVGRHECRCVSQAVTLTERSPDAKAAYLQGYEAGQRDVRKWKDIASAPRDGRQILIGYFKHPGAGDAVVAFWHSQQQAWCTTLQQLTTHHDWQPTHWMDIHPRPDGSRIV